MNVNMINNLAIITSDEILIKDIDSAMDLVANIPPCNMIVVNKENVVDEFFDLSTRLAGEVLQKYTKYNVKMAIIGDYSHIKSKSLNDFIYECNQVENFLFVTSIDDIIKLTS